jgi:hypothetical protein
MKPSSPRLLVIPLLALLLCTSCLSTEPEIPDPAYAGAWVYENSDPETNIRTYARRDTLDGDNSGYSFEPDGLLLFRTSGWCGTPPLSFYNLEGSWVEIGETELRITHLSAQEQRDFRLEILAISATEMRCRIELIE